MLFKEIVDARTDARTDDGRQTLKDHKSSLSTSCSGELKNNIELLLVTMSDYSSNCIQFKQIHFMCTFFVNQKG